MFVTHILTLSPVSLGQAVREKEHQSSGFNIKILNEFYFFPDPEKFIYMACAKESKWQLMPRPWDLSKFADIPFCRKTFFDEEIEITSQFSGRLRTKDGECCVEVTSKRPEGLSLDYELYYNHEESGKDISESLQLNNYVLLGRTSTTWSFGIRFPESGVYMLQIVGGRGYEYDLCAFKIVCDVPMENCKPLPYNPGKIGYGPNEETEKAGIVAQSHKTGVVAVSVRKHVEFNFVLKHKSVNMSSELVHPNIPPEQLKQYCIQTETKVRNMRNVSVQVAVPEGGEYALKIHAQQGGKSDYRNVCNYLLTSDERKKKLRSWEVRTKTVNKLQTAGKCNN